MRNTHIDLHIHRKPNRVAEYIIRIKAVVVSGGEILDVFHFSSLFFPIFSKFSVIHIGEAIPSPIHSHCKSLYTDLTRKGPPLSY